MHEIPLIAGPIAAPILDTKVDNQSLPLQAKFVLKIVPGAKKEETPKE
jgi:hypothetical protein